MFSAPDTRFNLPPLHDFNWKREEQIADLKLAYLLARFRISVALYLVAIYTPMAPPLSEEENSRWGQGYRFELDTVLRHLGCCSLMGYAVHPPFFLQEIVRLIGGTRPNPDEKEDIQASIHASMFPDATCDRDENWLHMADPAGTYSWWEPGRDDEDFKLSRAGVEFKFECLLEKLINSKAFPKTGHREDVDGPLSPFNPISTIQAAAGKAERPAYQGVGSLEESTLIKQYLQQFTIKPKASDNIRVDNFRDSIASYIVGMMSDDVAPAAVNLTANPPMGPLLAASTSDSSMSPPEDTCPTCGAPMGATKISLVKSLQRSTDALLHAKNFIHAQVTQYQEKVARSQFQISAYEELGKMTEQGVIPFKHMLPGVPNFGEPTPPAPPPPPPPCDTGIPPCSPHATHSSIVGKNSDLMGDFENIRTIHSDDTDDSDYVTETSYFSDASDSPTSADISDWEEHVDSSDSDDD